MLSALSDWLEELKNCSQSAWKWLELHSRWSALGSLGNSNLVKASVFMPAFGYMLLLNDNVHQYLTIKYDGWLLSYLPSVWRIWLLFYGSFLLALATILYSTFCSPDIKRYETPYAKADAETDHVYRIGGIKGASAELGEEYDGLSEKEDEIFTLAHIDLTNLTGNAPTQTAKISRILIHSYLIRNLKRPRLRAFIYILFRLGMALIAIPAVITFVQVTWLLVIHLVW